MVTRGILAPMLCLLVRGRLVTTTALVLVSVLLPAAAAQAGAFSKVFDDYKAHGNVNPCLHSEADLKKAKGQVPPDIQQYAPDFPTALDVALEARARGACGAGATSGGGSVGSSVAGAGAGATPPGPGGPASTAPGATPGPPPVAASTIDGSIPRAIAARRAASLSNAPAPLLIIALVAAALLLPALLWWAARLRGWEAQWLADARHAVGEAGYRSATTFSEFTDWVRLGR